MTPPVHTVTAPPSQEARITDLRRRRQEIDSELAALGAAPAEPERLRETVRTMQEQMKAFVHMLSHDLRGPLTVMHGHAGLLHDALGASTQATQRLSAEAIMRGVKRMHVMIEDLVDTARLESGQVSVYLQPVTLQTFLPAFITRNVGALATERLLPDVPLDAPAVLADAERLERILINLLSNAQKYAPPETPIRLQVRPAGDAVALAVIDQGPGIRSDDLPHLFDRFYRSKGERRADGIGLGLYITKLLVTALGGTIRAASTPGQGSTFTVRLQRAG